jgi:threonine dehydrogenase-like Zn-dependent dehydrogenase
MSQALTATSSAFQAVFFRDVQDVILRETRFDQVWPTDRMIEIDACGICGTDINAILQGAASYTPLGHEIAGRLLENNGQASAGRIVLESSSACGRCASCRNGRSDLCSDVRSFFARPYFGLAERMIAPEISVVPYRDLEPAVASLAEPLGVALDLCETADINYKSTVLVVGLGPIGLMALRLAKLAGASRIYASTFSKRERRNRVALEYGADELLLEDEKPLASRQLDPPPDCILITAPPPVIATCIPPAAPGAVLAYIGVGHGDSDRVSFPANEFHFKKLQLRASHASPALRTPWALELLRSGRIDGAKLISHRFPLSEAGRAIRAACLDKNEVIKVVVENDLGRKS